MFTRKHFRSVAKTVAEIRNVSNRKNVCESFIETFRKSNPRFDVHKFKAACNVQ